MSTTKTTFEDRLLAELTKEIERRPEEIPADGRTKDRVRRLATARRIAVVTAACAATWLAAVVVPGSPVEAKVYAVERHGDGSVTLKVRDQEIGIGAQRELARELRPFGIQVTVEVIDPGYVCEGDWGRRQPLRLWAVRRDDGSLVRVHVLQARSQITLRRGNLLVFENIRGADRPTSVNAFADKGDYKPCVPVRPLMPDDKPDDKTDDKPNAGPDDRPRD
ncbi:hypothetical protein [Streptomyces sp. UG1]|uniref:hypothetical protein n=1 Tax=Streptomyces sp. UG1 TaxID=3417652 RepID=UPI003CF59C5D